MYDRLPQLRTILPGRAVAAELLESDEDDFATNLLGSERGAIEGSGERRRREFAAGRECARRALAELGFTATAIAVAEDGAPAWPRGVVGAITHKGRYRAAAVAFESDVAGLGVDAELAAALPEGLLETISREFEMEGVARLLRELPGTPWDRLLFSAKETVAKALRPIEGRSLGLRSIQIRFDAEHGCFHGSAVDGSLATATGRWAIGGGMLLTAGAAACDEHRGAGI